MSTEAAAASTYHATVAVADLATADRAAMLGMMQRYYLGVTLEGFARDLDEKDQVMLLRDVGSGHVVGFSTLMRMDLEVGGTPARAVFSGDTIVDSQERNTFGLGIEITRYFLRTLERSPRTELYYVLISKGWQTARIPPFFFRAYSPAPGRPPHPRHKAVMDAFGLAKYPHAYDPAAGLIPAGQDAQRLRPDSPEGRLPDRRDKHVELFIERNPGYLRGDELVYVAPVTPANFSPAFLRLLRSDG